MTVPATLHLFLNPTRFLRYQDPATYIPPGRDLIRHGGLFFQERIVSETDEISLDGQDNYLPDTAEFQFAHDGRLWKRHMRTYLDGVVRMIAEDAIRARLYAGVRLDRIPSNEQKPFNLKEVETYFEFRSTTPLQTVKDIAPLVCSFNELRTSVDQYRPLLSTTWERDSFVITKRIRTGVKLKIYAKTNHRIRVEVVHDLTKASLRNQAGRIARRGRGIPSLLLEAFTTCWRL